MTVPGAWPALTVRESRSSGHALTVWPPESSAPSGLPFHRHRKYVNGSRRTGSRPYTRTRSCLGSSVVPARVRAVLLDAPDLAGLHEAAVVFNGFAGADTSWSRLVETSAPGLNLGKAAHRELLLRWLNSWGCRIRYPRDGEPAPFDTGIAAWWRAWRAALPPVSLVHLSDHDIDQAASAYAALSATVVGPRRTLGPTAAAKALFALRPAAIVPWDAAIATRLHGGRDRAAFHRHLRLGRAWAAAIIAEAGGDEAGVAEIVGRPGMSVAKILDEYLYVTISMIR